jgi:hypothetical protein
VIRLFDARGNFVKQVARDGAGPGEIRNANGMAVGSNDVVWVNDPANSRFSLFNSDGSFKEQIRIPITSYGYTWDGVVDDRGRAIDRISIRSAPGRAGGASPAQTKYRIIAPAGQVDTIDAPSCPARVPPPSPAYLRFGSETEYAVSPLPFLPQGQIVHTPAGVVWCTAAAEYSLSSGRIGQPVKEVVNRTVAPLPVSDQERKASLRHIDSLTQKYGKMTVGDPSLMPRTKPVIASLHGDAHGRAWVRQTSTSQANPAFDVFDADGKLVARVTSGGKVDGHLTWITDTHVFTVVLDDDDIPSVVRYRIVK